MPPKKKTVAVPHIAVSGVTAFGNPVRLRCGDGGVPDLDALRQHAGFDIAPERDQQLPGPGQDSDSPRPGEEALDGLAARVHRGANLIGWFAVDLHIDDGGRCRSLAGIANIRERLGGEGKGTPREPQHRHGPVAVLHAGGLRSENKRSAIGVDHDCRLRPFTFLPAPVAARPAALGGLHALAIENSGRGKASCLTRSRSVITS